jgi:hypothetical protein
MNYLHNPTNYNIIVKCINLGVINATVPYEF